MFFIIAFLAMGGYCVATKAQNAQTASTLENLQGKEVTKENYSQLVTNGEKPSSMKDALFKDGQAQKMFLLYNKGTGKFLTFVATGAQAPHSATHHVPSGCSREMKRRRHKAAATSVILKTKEKTGMPKRKSRPILIKRKSFLLLQLRNRFTLEAKKEPTEATLSTNRYK